MMRLLIIIGLLVVVPRFAVAQFPAEVRPGTRVRVWIPEPARQEEGPNRRQLLRGTVESVDGGPSSQSARDNRLARDSAHFCASSRRQPRCIARSEHGRARSWRRDRRRDRVSLLLNDPRRRGGPTIALIGRRPESARRGAAVSAPSSG